MFSQHGLNPSLWCTSRATGLLQYGSTTGGGGGLVSVAKWLACMGRKSVFLDALMALRDANMDDIT